MKEFHREEPTLCEDALLGDAMRGSPNSMRKLEEADTGLHSPQHRRPSSPDITDMPPSLILPHRTWKRSLVMKRIFFIGTSEKSDVEGCMH